jgi:hypothetical protein
LLQCYMQLCLLPSVVATILTNVVYCCLTYKTYLRIWKKLHDVICIWRNSINWNNKSTPYFTLKQFYWNKGTT